MTALAKSELCGPALGVQLVVQLEGIRSKRTFYKGGAFEILGMPRNISTNYDCICLNLQHGAVTAEILQYLHDVHCPVNVPVLY